MKRFGDQSGGEKEPERRQKRDDIPQTPGGGAESSPQKNVSGAGSSPQKPGYAASGDPQDASGAADNFPFLEVGEYGKGGREAFIAQMEGRPVPEDQKSGGAVTGSFSDGGSEWNESSYDSSSDDNSNRTGVLYSESSGESRVGAPGDSAGSAGEKAAEDEALDSLELYLEELKNIEPLTPSEENLLLEKAAEGSTAARDRLIEGHLMDALRVLQNFMGGPLSVTEMIGIANLSLVQAVQDFVHAAAAQADSQTSDALSRHVRETVRSEIRAALDEERTAQNGADSVAALANRITEASRVLANELGRQPSVDELAERMKIAPDEVRELLKMTMQAMDSGSGLE